MPSIRVMHFGLGPVGTAVAKQVAAPRGLMSVAAADSGPAKVGHYPGDGSGMTKRVVAKLAPDAAHAIKAATPRIIAVCTNAPITQIMTQLAPSYRAKRVIVSTSQQMQYRGHPHVIFARK